MTGFEVHSRRAFLAVGFVLCAGLAAPASGAPLPDYWSLLYPGEPRTPVLDVVYTDLCSVPESIRGILSAARQSGSRRDQLRAREALLAWGPVEASEEEKVCVRLEATRLALQQGLLPETVAEASSLLASGDRAAGQRIETAARWFRLEARFRAGRREELRDEYQELANTEDPLLRAAAALRLADLDFDAGNSNAALDRYESLLGQASGVPDAMLGPWRWRAAEAALASGREEEAVRWLDLARSIRLPESIWSVATLQRAALHAAAGEIDGSAALRSEVRRLRPRGFAARIATWIDWTQPLASDPSGAAAIATRLRDEALMAPTPRLASFARSLEIEAFLAAAEPAAALERIGVLLVDPWTPTALVLSPRLDQALLAAVRQENGCARVVAAVAGWEPLVHRLVSDAQPLAALGTCHLELGLLDSALAALRVARERFGAESIALPMARASLEAGRADVAENAARDRIAKSTPEIDSWRLLLAEALLAVDDPDGAEAELAELVRADRRGPARSRAISLLAALSSQRALSNGTRFLLADAVIGAADAEWQGAGESLATAALAAARLTRDAHDPAGAVSLYELAARRLPSGERRAQAFYWAGRLAGESGRAALHAAAQESGPWSELARTRLAIDSIGREAIGATSTNPS